MTPGVSLNTSEKSKQPSKQSKTLDMIETMNLKSMLSELNNQLLNENQVTPVISLEV